MKYAATFPLLLSVACLSTWAGCSKPAVEPAKPEAAAKDEKADAFAGLSPEDRVKAIAQRICPVTKEELGGMGKPYKVTVEGRDVFLCCAGCEEEIKKDPQKYFAILDEAATKSEKMADGKDDGAKAN
jgi:YHS domain-containing protein